MATRKKKSSSQTLHPTSIDYIIVALVPALIMGMICGLTFFLIFAFYQGNFSARLIYLFGLFIFAAVLIARIAVEEGRGYASLFAIPLGLASLVTINSFARVEGPLANISWLINAGLIGLIWFLADRITLDCTVIDERTQDSQQGLLQSLGMLRREEALVSKPQVRGSETKTKKSKVHNPGVWVMYFALLALPMFGLGQLVLPESTTTTFMCLVAYLGCALALLAATSFLSMRRYVRQKGVEMPVEVTSKWLPLSVAAIFATLLIALILPLPGRSLGLVGSPIKFSSGDLDTSRFGWGDEGSGEDDNEAASKTESEEGPPEGPAEEDGKGNPQATDDGKKTSQQKGGSEKGDQRGENGEQSNPSDSDPSNSESPGDKGQQASQESNSGDREKTDASDSENKQSDPSSKPNDQRRESDNPANDEEDQANNENGQRNNQDGQGNNQENDGANDQRQQDGGPQSAASSPPPNFIPQINANFSELLKWITMLVLAAIVVFYLITHPHEVRAMWAAFRQWLANLFGRKKTAHKGPAPARIAPPPQKKPFRDYINPFNSGQTFSPDKVITHTYQALQAWAEEHGTTIDDETTPTELADRLTQLNPSVGKQSKLLAQMVNRLLFARWSPAEKDIAPLQRLWQNMSAS
ncbi:MAG: DUF4129 domain-containing protein [Aureliella sp.]